MSASIGDEDLDAAIAEGILTPETASRLPNSWSSVGPPRRGRRTVSAADGLQRHLRFDRGSLGADRARLARRPDRPMARSGSGRGRVLGSGGILHGEAADGAAEHRAAAGLGGGRVGRLAVDDLRRHSVGAGGPRLVSSALAAGVAAYTHWLRFKVPITVAAGTGAVLGLLILIASTTISDGFRLVLPLIFLSGLLLFGLALWWDMSHPGRRTRRADVGFWLHLSAAPLLVHPAFPGSD